MAGPAAPLQLYDTETGAPIAADAATAGELVRSGRAGFLPDQQVVLQGQDGQLRQVTGAEAADYLSSAEARFGGGGLGTAEGLRRQQVQEQYGGLGGTALATGAGALRGASVGLSDALLAGTGLVERKTLAGLQEANPFASGVGEVAGMIAPALLSGGSSGAAAAAARVGGTAGRGLRAVEVASALAPSTLVSRAGLAVEGALAGAEAGALRRGLAAATGAAVEGSLFGVGQEISRATLKDEKITAEKLVAAAGHGALLGGLAGAGTSAVGTLLRGAASKASDAGAGLLRRFEAKEGALAGELAAAAPKTEATVQALASRAERELTLRAVGADAQQVAKLREMGPDIEARVLRLHGEDLSKALGKEGGSLRTIEDRATGAKKLAAEAEEKVKGLAAEVDKTGAKIDMGRAATEFRAANPLTTAPTRDKAGRYLAQTEEQKVAREMDRTLADLEKAGEADLSKAADLRAKLQKQIDAGGSDALQTTRRDLLKSLDDAIAAKTSEVQAQLGPEFAARWANAQAEHKAASWLSETLSAGAAKKAVEKGSSLTDQVGMIAGHALSGQGPMGMALAVGGAYLNHLAKVYGADVGAQIARSVRQGEVVSTVERSFDQLLGKNAAALAGAVRGTLEAARPAVPLTLASVKAYDARDNRKLYEEKSKALAAFATSPKARVEAATAGLAPSQAKAVGAVVERGADFLRGKLPRRPIPEGVPAQIAKKSEPSPDEISKFLRYARAVDDPLAVLEDAKKGRLSPEAVEAVKAVYPSIHAAIVEEVQSALLNRTKPLSWKEEVQLARLGIPTSPNLQPDAVALYQRLQSAAPEGAPVGAAPAPKGLSRPINPPRLATRTDTLGASENV